MNSCMFQGLMECLDTPEGIKPSDAPRFQEPAPSHRSEPLLPERGPFLPRKYPLGGMELRTRFVLRLLGNSVGRTASAIRGESLASKEDQINETAKDRSREENNDPCNGNIPATSNTDRRSLTDTELRELRQKTLISSLLQSASRWGGR